MATILYSFNIEGNFSTAIDEMGRQIGQFNAAMKSNESLLDRWLAKFSMLDMVSGFFERLGNTIDDTLTPFIALDSQMHDLSAIAGVTGDALKEIEGYARESAKTFGTDAAVAVEGYKLLLSQLSPELAKCPKALQEMGNAIQTTSKLMGNDGVAAAEVLTTAMNQYGVSLDDPMEASRKMSEMIIAVELLGEFHPHIVQDFTLYLFGIYHSGSILYLRFVYTDLLHTPPP
ncbi:MAG: hypothetical protein IJY36_03695 [Coprobacter sp.]|nr:hypothetical protein [Coprobacter sp.]